MRIFQSKSHSDPLLQNFIMTLAVSMLAAVVSMQVVRLQSGLLVKASTHLLENNEHAVTLLRGQIRVYMYFNIYFSEHIPISILLPNYYIRCFFIFQIIMLKYN